MNQSLVCIGLGQGGELKTVQIVRRGEPVLYRFYLRRLCPAYRHHSHIPLLSLLLAILSGCAPFRCILPRNPSAVWGSTGARPATSGMRLRPLRLSHLRRRAVP